MSLPRLSLCTAALLLALSPLNAQSVTTAPVGAVTIDVSANSERRLGLSLARPSLYAASVVTATPTSLASSSTVPSLADGPKYIIFTSGQASGQWFQVTAANSSSLSISDGDLVAAGVQPGDKFEIRLFWTLASLLPAGGGLPVSSNPFSPNSLLLTYDPAATGTNIPASKSYLYYDGSAGGNPGWYENGTFQPADNVVISPEVFFSVRNFTASNSHFVIVGNVPSTPLATTIIADAAQAQDNLVFNPYPQALTLATSGLLENQVIRPSSNPFAPTDLVFIYPQGSTPINAAPADSYLYYDGSMGGDAGWYKSGSFETANSVTIPDGNAILIRKSSGSSQDIIWKPNIPYAL